MLSWQRAVGAEGTAFRIKWLGSRWMAVGADAGDAATWTSTDGLTWTAGAPILPAASEDPQALSSFWINDVIELDTGYLAVGWNSLGGGDGGRAATWTSPDGVEWTHHDPAGTPFGETYHGPFRIVRLASGEVLLLSWTGLGSGAMLWISDDGRTWSELPTRWDDMYAAGLAEGPDGVMLIGLTWSDSVPTALVSTDARTWTPVVAPPGAKELRDVSYDEVGGRFVVGGVDESERPTVWLSTDGRSWATTRLDDRAGHVGGVSTHGGLIALSGQIGLEDAQAMVWASHDGITWSINEMGPGSAGALGAAPDGVVLWVRWWDDSSEQQALWFGTLR